MNVTRNYKRSDIELITRIFVQIVLCPRFVYLFVKIIYAKSHREHGQTVSKAQRLGG